MKDTKCRFFRRVTGLCSSAAPIFMMLVLIAAVTTASAQTPVFVPGNASGCFGNPADMCIPLVAAITVSGPGTITVTYVSGTVTDCCGTNAGPNGAPWTMNGAQAPLQEARGVLVRKIKNLDALIGVFVPQLRVQRANFSPLDGTKGVTTVGIMPWNLFFIGTGKTFPVSGAGTLYLGINDWGVGDNGGGFNVTVTGP